MTSTRQPKFTHDNSVKLIRGGREYFDLLEKLIEGAKHTIYFQIYIFDGDETGNRVANALKEAARRKVRVFLLLDGYASQNLPKEVIEQLQEAGVCFRWFKPWVKSKRFFLGRRMHHKVFVVDDLHSLVGGLNVSDRYNDIGETPAWLDWAVYAQGSVASGLAEVCRKRMRDVSARSISLANRDQIHGQPCSVRILINDRVRRKSQITKCYLQMLKNARSGVIIMSPYFLPGYQIRKQIKLASKRGVKVQLILAGVSDISLAKYAERFMYDWLHRYNIEIFEYQKSVLHGKIATCDGEVVTVGSYNVNNLSAYLSIELNLEIKDEIFASHTQKLLQQIINNDCLPITRAVYKSQSNLLKHVLQVAAYGFFRLLFYVFTFRLKFKE